MAIFTEIPEIQIEATRTARSLVLEMYRLRRRSLFYFWRDMSEAEDQALIVCREAMHAIRRMKYINKEMDQVIEKQIKYWKIVQGSINSKTYRN